MLIRVERVEALPVSQLGACDFSFEIEGELLPPYDDPSRLRSLAARRKDYHFDLHASGSTAGLFVASIDTQIAGYAVVSPSWNGMAELREIGVDRPFRGNGVARALLENCESWARDRKFRYLRLETQANNPAACRLYPKSGYRVEGFDRSLYAAGESAGEIALFFYKQLC